MTATTDQSKAQKFENERASVLVHRKPGSRVEFSIHLNPAITGESHKAALKAVTKHVSLPGFRKGRAPETLVTKRFPAEIERQWQEDLALRGMKEAEALTHISPLSRSSKIHYQVKKHNLTEGAEMTASFETEPFVPEIDPKRIELKPVARPVVDDAKVEETIRQTRFFFAKWSNIEDRPVAENDCVLLDVENIEADSPKKVFTNTRFEVTTKGMAKWMFDLVLGRSKGESLEGTSVPDEEVPEKEKAEFKPQKVRITIRAIEQAELPELDENFFKSVGVESFEQLKSQIHLILQRQADAHVQTKLREQVSEQLLEKFPFDLPFTLIERETNFRMHHLLQDSVFANHWEKMDEKTKQDTLRSIFDQSQKAVRMFYLCRKLTGAAKIEINPQDTLTTTASPLESLLNPSSDSLFSSQKEMQQAEAFSRLLLEKTEDYLIAHATMLAE